MTCRKIGLCAVLLACAAFTMNASAAVIGPEGGIDPSSLLISRGNGQGNGWGWRNRQLEEIAALLASNGAESGGEARNVVYLALDFDGAGWPLHDPAAGHGQLHRLVAALDYDRGEVRMWLDPDMMDFDRGLESSADLVQQVSGNGYWAAVRNLVGPVSASDWQAMAVGPTLTSVGVVPEPASLGLLALSAILCLRRRR
jgi:hypothetical protein